METICTIGYRIVCNSGSVMSTMTYKLQVAVLIPDRLLFCIEYFITIGLKLVNEKSGGDEDYVPLEGLL